MTRREATAPLACLLLLSIASIAGARLNDSNGDTWAEAKIADLPELLSGIDFVPNRTHFNDADVTNGDLINIARDRDADPGQRIRAYRALSHYPSPESEKALADGIAEHSVATTGVEIIYLRAVIRSFATITGAPGANEIIPLLDHESRDIRATAAEGLAICGSPLALLPLRARLDIEESEQVKSALIEAIRVLTEG